MNRSVVAVLAVQIMLLTLVSTGCTRAKNDSVLTPVPFLTGRTWLADTIVLTPPQTFSQLTSAEQQQLVQANAFFKTATLRLNENGSVIQTDWDFGFTRWKLVNNDLDIEMSNGNGTKRILSNWQASAIRFNYTIPFGSYQVDYRFK